MGCLNLETRSKLAKIQIYEGIKLEIRRSFRYIDNIKYNKIKDIQSYECTGDNKFRSTNL